MNLGLTGRRALVCGASSGLGRAIALELAREGAQVVLCARSPERLAAATGWIRGELGGDGVSSALHAGSRESGARESWPLHTIAADLSTPEGRGRALEGAVEALRAPLEILVTNTGGPPSGPREAHSADTWQASYASLLASVIELTGAVIPAMRDAGFGRIVNVTSISVKQPVEGLILSNTFRAGVTGFARTVANEVAPHGITVNNVLPGYTRTERLGELAAAGAARTGASPEAFFERWAAETPAGRLGEPDELAALTAFLCSTRAGFITGQSIAVDGGWVRGLL
jgi:3-oxoacyl-[acyl-carrier protein] reductase